MEYVIYRCPICGNIILKDARTKDMPVCCNRPMEKALANTDDTVSKEKHVPVVNVNGNTCYVMVGSAPHPMEEKHYISHIMLVTNKSNYVEKLDVNSDPYAVFDLADGEKPTIAYSYCNLHGLWQANIK